MGRGQGQNDTGREEHSGTRNAGSSEDTTDAKIGRYWVQRFEMVRAGVADRFRERWSKVEQLPNFRFSWSNWAFGQESLDVSLRRLSAHGISYVELHGNRHGPDLGYKPLQVKNLLSDQGISASGVCGIFSVDNDLSSPTGSVRQRAVDYVRRNLELAHDVGAEYMLIVPGAVGRNKPVDPYEFDRSVETLSLVADDFIAAGVKGAIEPIRSAEVSFCHTLADAVSYIDALGHPGVQHVNADIYHMLSEEAHPYEALVAYGERILNLHLADTHRGALGQGCLDLDLVLMALHCTDFASRGYCTAEPLGSSGDPYPAMFGRPSGSALNALVSVTATTFFEREQAIRSNVPERIV